MLHGKWCPTCCRKVMSSWFGTHCLYLDRRRASCITEIHSFNVRWSVYLTSSSVCFGTPSILQSFSWSFKLKKLSMCVYTHIQTHTHKHKCNTNTNILCSRYKTTTHPTYYVHLTDRKLTLTCSYRSSSGPGVLLWYFPSRHQFNNWSGSLDNWLTIMGMKDIKQRILICIIIIWNTRASWGNTKIQNSQTNLRNMIFQQDYIYCPLSASICNERSATIILYIITFCL